MKVYIITSEPFPHGMAGTNRIKCYVKALKKSGVQCEVIIFTRTEIYGKAPKNTIGKGVYDGMHFTYIGGTPLRHKNVIVRKFNDFKDRWRAMLFLSRNLQAGDIVLSYCGVYARYINWVIDIAHGKKVKFVRDLCELPYGTSKETNSKVKWRNYTQTRQFPKCDGFIAISDSLVELAEKYKKTDAQILKVPIMVDFHKYSLPDKSSEAHIPYIFHSGTLTEQKDGILGMIEAFGMALQKLSMPIMFISTGNKESSPHREAINELIEKYHLEKKLVFTGYLSETELKEYLSKASLVIINKYETQQNKYCFSTKLAEYMAASKPVIITRVGEAMNWLTDNRDAYVVGPHDTSALAEKIVEAFTNSEKRYVIASNGFETCKACFDYENYGDKLVDFFTKLSNNGN